MRVHQFVPPWPHGLGNGTGRGASHAAAAPTPQAQVDEVVHLTLGGDGVWQLTPYTPSYASFIPRAVLHTYSPRGATQAIEQERGCVLDVYV